MHTWGNRFVTLLVSSVLSQLDSSLLLLLLDMSRNIVHTYPYPQCARERLHMDYYSCLFTYVQLSRKEEKKIESIF